MTIAQYMSSLPMNTRYYLLGHSSEPDKVKEVLKEKANDSAFLAELTKHIQAMQSNRIAQQAQHVTDNIKSVGEQVPAYIIDALKMPLEKRCKVCGKVINAGNYCEECGKELARNNY